SRPRSGAACALRTWRGSQRSASEDASVQPPDRARIRRRGLRPGDVALDAAPRARLEWTRQSRRELDPRRSERLPRARGVRLGLALEALCLRGPALLMALRRPAAARAGHP